MRLSRRILLAGGLGLTAAACAGDKAGVPFRIGYQKNGVLFVARERGGADAALKAAGAGRVSWSEFASGPPLLEALAASAIDFGSTGDSPPIFAQAAGADLVYAAAVPLSGAAAAILVKGDSPLRTAADLRGKRVAFAQGSSAQNLLTSALAAEGMTLADIRPLNLGPADGGAALSRGDADAWVIWDPYYALSELGQKTRALVSGEVGPRSYQFYLASRAFAEGQPAVLSAMLNHLRAEGAWAKAHPAEVAAIMSKATGVETAVQQRVAMRQDYAIGPVTPAIVTDQQALADRLVAEGLAPKRVDIAAAVWRGWTPT
jgi:aliphatic sulfonates family ABC transporter substrate-binding protein